MGAPVVHGTYTATGKRRWIVPLNSVCTRLGINYKLSNGKIYISGTTQSSSNNTTGSTTTTTTTTKPSTTGSKIRLRLSLMQDTVDQILVQQGMEWQRRT